MVVKEGVFQTILQSIDIEMLMKLLISAVLGLGIGLERELKRKPFGLKTSLVISIVSCLLTIVSIQSAYLFPGSEFINIQMDPLRLAAQIVSGIGFLGAGVILRREDDTITGITTAAMVWGAAGIGIACGAGFYIEAIMGVVLIIISVELIPNVVGLLGFWKFSSKEFTLKVILKDRAFIGEVIRKIEEDHIKIENVRIKDLLDGSFLVDLKVRASHKMSTSEIYDEISKINHIYSTEIAG
ncbi:MgtC/SapB family protein [Neobacillus notoginsengisoli]|uniref:MgtC/SapB family protein n=1 Tax=Neobacillus notoginsengisoli TaxID=1578198 RepID=A0A417YEU4_9BACI|nr:MgtC/SapB family protein [Neobacillus notoginsengisoli]RHW31172.1 MgtC/SapB family protein [Neobacillus notoginsengisoli]